MGLDQVFLSEEGDSWLVKIVDSEYFFQRKEFLPLRLWVDMINVLMS